MNVLKRMVSGWIDRNIFYIAYLLAGLALAVPYALLADGHLENVGKTMFMAPLLGIIAWALYAMTRVKCGTMFAKVGLVFVGYLAWLAIPIAFRVLSIIYDSAYLYYIRYYMLVVVPYALIIPVILGALMCKAYRDWRREKSDGGTTPPTSFMRRIRERFRRSPGTDAHGLKFEAPSTVLLTLALIVSGVAGCTGLGAPHTRTIFDLNGGGLVVFQGDRSTLAEFPADQVVKTTIRGIITDYHLKGGAVIACLDSTVCQSPGRVRCDARMEPPPPEVIRQVMQRWDASDRWVDMTQDWK